VKANTLSRQIAKAGFEYDRAVYTVSRQVRGYGSWRSGFHVNETQVDGAVSVRWIHSGKEFAVASGMKKMPLIADAIRDMGYIVEVIPAGEYESVIRLIVKEAI
jgi:hypothetical protein